MFPEVIGCFGSFNIIHPCSGDLAMVDQTMTSVPAAMVHPPDVKPFECSLCNLHGGFDGFPKAILSL